MWRLGALRQSSCNPLVKSGAPKRIITIRRSNATVSLVQTTSLDISDTFRMRTFL
jgi:hypothetical protein